MGPRLVGEIQAPLLLLLLLLPGSRRCGREVCNRLQSYALIRGDDLILPHVVYLFLVPAHLLTVFDENAM